MIAGIDIGGTKTQLTAEAQPGQRRDVVVPTADWRNRRDRQSDAVALADLVSAFTETTAPAALVVGSHGCDTDDDCIELQTNLARQLGGTILVLNDSELLLPAAGRERGFSLVSGTGSIAVGRRADRKMIAAGGWGWYLGDEGSASGLVRDAARAVRAALDAGEPLDQLGRSLMQALSVGNPVELGRALSDLGSAADIGNLAPTVFEAVEAGSGLAARVIAEGGKALALLAERLVARGATAGDVVAGGGVITRQPRLFDAFRAALAEQLPLLRVTLYSDPPVEGAVRLARRLANGERPQTLPLPHVDGRLATDEDGRAA